MSNNDKNLQEDWKSLLEFLKSNLGKKPQDVNAVLFLIGVQELGQGKKVFTKEQKQDLIHIATCKILSLGGYYELNGTDADGWPHWVLIKPIAHFSLSSQENLLKHYILEYFRSEIGLHI